MLCAIVSYITAIYRNFIVMEFVAMHYERFPQEVDIDFFNGS